MKGDIGSSFSMYSSSVTTGYNKELGEKFKANVSLEGLHSVQGESAMQGPFTRQHVGGRQHRRVSVNVDPSLTSVFNRPEAWYIFFSSDGLAIKDPTSVESGVNAARAKIYREERTSRPVNIRNIKHTTGSANLGNYDKNYQVVQTSGRRSNNLSFVDNEGFQQESILSQHIT